MKFLGACRATRLGDLGARPPKLGSRAHGPLVIFTPVVLATWLLVTMIRELHVVPIPHLQYHTYFEKKPEKGILGYNYLINVFIS